MCAIWLVVFHFRLSGIFILLNKNHLNWFMGGLRSSEDELAKRVVVIDRKAGRNKMYGICIFFF